MSVLEIPVWKQAPFIRLFPPFCAGIITRQLYQLPPEISWSIFCPACLLLCTLRILPSSYHHKYYPINGCLLQLLLASTGMLITWHADIKNHPQWIGHYLPEAKNIIVTIDEPLSEKNKSFKAHASIAFYHDGRRLKKTRGNLVIYFNKDSLCSQLKPGYQIGFQNRLQQIKPTGNPGAFDYADYASLQGIYHQVYLKAGDFVVIKAAAPGLLKQFIFSSREKLISILRSYIPGRTEAGLAEALLIGYKDDLDKTVLNAYINTGVVHVIAISGLHLGLIYWLLALILKPIGKRKRISILKPILIITGLWVFSLLAGASPSVLRSALMFTFIVAGEKSGRKTTIYNSLAASAFLLLCYNPFWLWDSGFQLSYIAVLSLVVYMQPVYNSIFIKNKLLDTVWKLSAVTIAAQVLTFPICIYLFHQFPVFFLLSNLLAIPLSSLVLLFEIFLCAAAVLPSIATATGTFTGWLIRLMNGIIFHIRRLPFSNITSLQLSLYEVLLLYVVIIMFSFAVLRQSKKSFYMAMTTLILFCSSVSLNLYNAATQHKLIVYNIRACAVEIVNGRRSFLLCDAHVQQDALLNEYCLKPSLVFNRIRERKFITIRDGISNFNTGGKKVTLLSRQPVQQATSAHLLIITGNPSLDLKEYLYATRPLFVVFDATNSPRKLAQWIKDCKDADIRFHNVAEKGAFVINLNSLSFATP